MVMEEAFAHARTVQWVHTTQYLHRLLFSLFEFGFNFGLFSFSFLFSTLSPSASFRGLYGIHTRFYLFFVSWGSSELGYSHCLSLDYRIIAARNFFFASIPGELSWFIIILLVPTFSRDLTDRGYLGLHLFPAPPVTSGGSVSLYVFTFLYCGV